jgi:flagellar hook assembly protein FlgD
VVVEDPVLPREFALRQNAPNPFNPVTVIQYELPEATRVRIDVFNLAGRLVKTIVDEGQQPGYKSVAWDGTNADGQKVASGVYLYRMQAGSYESEKTMVLLK